MLGVSGQGAAMGILTDHKYASTLPEAAAFAVNGGLDLEDANNAKETVFGGIADAIKLGLLEESQVDESVSRLMFVRMRTGEFDDPALQPYRKIPTDQVQDPDRLLLILFGSAGTLSGRVLMFYRLSLRLFGGVGADPLGGAPVAEPACGHGVPRAAREQEQHAAALGDDQAQDRSGRSFRRLPVVLLR